MVRQHRICLGCQRANPKKVIKLHLIDRFCRFCGADISSPMMKGANWDLIEVTTMTKPKITYKRIVNNSIDTFIYPPISGIFTYGSSGIIP